MDGSSAQPHLKCFRLFLFLPPFFHIFARVEIAQIHINFVRLEFQSYLCFTFMNLLFPTVLNLIEFSMEGPNFEAFRNIYAGRSNIEIVLPPRNCRLGSAYFQLAHF